MVTGEVAARSCERELLPLKLSADGGLLWWSSSKARDRAAPGGFSSASHPGDRARPASKRCGSSEVFSAVVAMGKS
jgi:hypothetical protein